MKENIIIANLWIIASFFVDELSDKWIFLTAGLLWTILYASQILLEHNISKFEYDLIMKKEGKK